MRRTFLKAILRRATPARNRVQEAWLSRAPSGDGGSDGDERLVARRADRVSRLELRDFEDPLDRGLEGTYGQSASGTLQLPADEEKLTEASAADILQACKIKNDGLDSAGLDLLAHRVTDDAVMRGIKPAVENHDEYRPGFFKLDFHG